MRWRTQKAGVSIIAKSYDMASACHSGSQVRLHDAARRRIERTDDNNEHSSPILGSSASAALNLWCALTPHDGIGYFHLRFGGAMGDNNEPELFIASYHFAVRRWTRNTEARISDPLTITCPITTLSKTRALTRSSMTSYAS